MPMNFPDMQSLLRCAEMWSFRKPFDGETEENYRSALADFVEPNDLVEAEEIRNKVGHDQWTEEQRVLMILKKIGRHK